MDIDQIISEIFSRPALWDQKNKLYHNRVYVEKLWTSVAAEIKVPKEDLKKKWKYLRDQFRSELKKTPTPKSGDAGDTASQITSTWPYFQSLLFLKDQMKYRNLGINLKPRKFKNSQVEEYENKDIHNTSQIEESEEINERYESWPKRKRTTNSSSAELLEIEKNQLLLLQKRNSESKTVLDEDEAFFLTLLPHIRKLEPETKFLCRMEMQNTLYKYVYGKANSLPALPNERSRYEAISSPISTSSENVYSTDLSTSGHFQSSTFVPIEIKNESLDQIQRTKDTSIYYADSIHE
ncbi:uncharacterized protein [Eurosta solidaginis]|uniref:uncharacterized protein n=1 Tax=Eurosta solidaginis TaxID=178769 RepID=UPI0035316DF9